MGRGFIRNINLSGMWLFNLNFAWFAYIVAWLGRKLKFSMPFARDTAQLVEKQQWCIDVLKKNGVLPADAVINGFRVIALSQETIFRSNIGRVDIDYSSSGESKTLQCMAKFAPLSGTVWNRAVFNMQLNHVKEIYFNKYFAAVDKAVAAPKVYYAGFALFTGNLCLIMEYMGDDREYREGEIDNMPAEHLNMVFEGMAALHAQYWNNQSGRLKKVFPIIPATVDFFDSLVAGKWSIPARKILVQSWCNSNEPQTVIHGDARIGNMMFPGNNDGGRFVFIDWQAVRRGKGAYDLAYFLVLSLSTTNRQAVEQQAMDTYYKYLIAKGVTGYTRQQLDEDYKHACLCVLILLALPMLSGEASAEGQGAIIFAWGMNIWRERMAAKFEDFDYTWLANNYQITGQQGKQAVAEMLKVIEDRLKGINAGAAV